MGAACHHVLGTRIDHPLVRFTRAAPAAGVSADALIGFHIPGIGLVLAIALILVTGIFAANVIGRWVVARWEKLLEKIPLVRPIYSGVKQIMETVLSNRTESFKEVVLIEFPKKDCWTYGFIVSTPGRAAAAETGYDDVVTVFVPTAPNPTSGYVLMAPRSQLKRSRVSIEDAFKFHVSLGVMSPKSLEAQSAVFQVQKAPTVRRSNNAAKKVSTPF